MLHKHFDIAYRIIELSVTIFKMKIKNEHKGLYMARALLPA